MNNVKQSWGKLFLVTVLSMGFIGSGIGSISWAMFSMWVPSYSFADVTHSSNSIPTTLDAKPHKLMEDSIAPVQTDPTQVLITSDKTIYPVYPAEDDNIGSLTIPVLNQKWTIFQGTDVKELKKGVGHFIQSVLPGEKDNCVLSGHRETVFRQIGQLKTGDQLIVQTSAGTFTYEVNGTRIVHADDKTVIVPTDHAVLTMTTCYPFNTPGYLPDRYIVSATLVTSK